MLLGPALAAGCTSQPPADAAVEQPVMFYRADCRDIDHSPQLAAQLEADKSFCADQAQTMSLREPASGDPQSIARALETSRFACMIQRDYFVESASRNWSRCTMKKLGV